MSSNIYRRGAIYWWRRSVRCALGPVSPTMVRISLRTPVLALARTRAAWLEMQIGSVGMEIQSSAAGLKPADFRPVYQQAFKTALDRYLGLQQDTPWREDDHIASNLAHARYFTMTAASEFEPWPGTELARQLEGENLSPAEIELMQAIAGYYRHGSAINPNYVRSYLRQAGYSESAGNIERARRVAALGYREACIEAAMALGAPDPRPQLPPIPRSLRAVIGEEVLPMSSIPAPQAALAPTPIMSLTPASMPVPMPAHEQHGIDCQVSSLADEAVTTNIENGKWSETCRGDVRGALKLFVAANGDLLLSQIRQSHLADMCKLFSRMPAVWGKTQKGGTKENPIYETVEQALERGQRMKEEWDADPVAAEMEEKPRPGLSVATRNKHLQWITSVFEFGSGHGYVKVDVDAKPLKLKDKDFKHEKRLPWEPNELAKLLSGPTWSGCAGIEHRLAPGETIIHDAMYFAPLLITSHAARSKEVNGLMLTDVIDDHSTPHIRYQDNAFRKLKTKYSRRSLPIHPGLIELGFLDYVQALRDAGMDLVFPEMWNPELGFEKTFREKVFYPLRDFHFPDGTSQKKKGKDVDVHSIRKTGLNRLFKLRFDTNDRNRFGGHALAGETDITYTEAAEAEHFVPMVDELWKLVPQIEPAPIVLRPIERLQFGSPRGRPKAL